MNQRSKMQPYSLSKILQNSDFVSPEYKLPIIIGKNISDKIVCYDLNKLSRILIAGREKTGKTNLIKLIISSLIAGNTANQCKLAIINSNNDDYEEFKRIPHLFCPIVESGAEESKNVLELLITELNNRRIKIRQHNVKNISEYNKIPSEKIPYLVIIIDDFSDLYTTLPQKFENFIQQISTFGCSVGIHIIISTKHITEQNCTDFIGASFTTHISFKTSTAPESELIIWTPEAVNLQEQHDILLIETAKPAIHIKTNTFIER